MLTNKGGEWADQPLPWHAEAFQKILQHTAISGSPMH